MDASDANCRSLPFPRGRAKQSPPWQHGTGPVAQRLEQGTHNPLVVGSNPTGPTFTIRGCDIVEAAAGKQPGRTLCEDTRCCGLAPGVAFPC